MEKYNDLELDALRRFWSDTQIREAVEKVFTQSFSVPRDPKLTNVEIGERQRAIWAAQDIIKTAFQEIELLNIKVEIPETKLNKAR